MKSLLLLTFTLSSYFVFSQPLFTIPSTCKNKYTKFTTATASKDETRKEGGVFYRTNLNFVFANGKKYQYQYVDLFSGKTPNSANKVVRNGEIIYKGISKSKYFYYVVLQGWTGKDYDYNGYTNTYLNYHEIYWIRAYYLDHNNTLQDKTYQIPVSDAGDFGGVNGDAIEFSGDGINGPINFIPWLEENPNSIYGTLDWCMNCASFD